MAAEKFCDLSKSGTVGSVVTLNRSGVRREEDADLTSSHAGGSGLGSGSLTSSSGSIVYNEANLRIAEAAEVGCIKTAVSRELLEAGLTGVGIVAGIDNADDLILFGGSEAGITKNKILEVFPRLSLNICADAAAEKRMKLNDVVFESVSTALGEGHVVVEVTFERGERRDLQAGKAVGGANGCKGVDSLEGSGVRHVGGHDGCAVEAIIDALYALTGICALVLCAYKKSTGGAGGPENKRQGGHYGCLGGLADALYEALGHAFLLFFFLASRSALSPIKCGDTSELTGGKGITSFFIVQEKLYFFHNFLLIRIFFRFLLTK